MGLFDVLSQWRSNAKIKSLEAAVQSRPTPILYLQLADAHKGAGNVQKAAQVLKLGAARFPSAPEIVRRQQEAEKVEREAEKKRLVDKIQSHPNPILYARLAELYKADNEINKTIDTCVRGIKAFPKYGGTYLVLGQIYSEKRQWAEAVAQLEKSVQLDKYNYLALKLLAQVYIELSRPSEAAQKLEDILYFAPGDEAILELLKKAKELANQSPGGGAVDSRIPESPVPPPQRRQTRMTGMMTRQGPQAKMPPTPRAGSSVPPPNLPSPFPTGRATAVQERVTPAAPAKSARDVALNNGLATLRSVASVTGAILVDQYGLVVASDLTHDIDEGLAGALITNVYRTASGNSVKLDVGTFEEGLIEGEHGNIHIVQLEEMILAVFAKADVKMGLLEKTIRDFASIVEKQR